MNTILLYIINSPQEIPTNPLPNTAYYVLGKQVIIYDNAGGKSVYSPEAEVEEALHLDERLSVCENKLTEITNYLTNIPKFGGN